MTILIIHGPNLNLLGARKPETYGYKTLDEINSYIKDYFKKVDFETFQNNSESAIIEKLHTADNKYDGIVINAGAYSHYSYAIRDAIEAIQIPCVEVHMSNVFNREEFRQKSVIASVCIGSVSGFAEYSYILAARALIHQKKSKI